MSPRHEGHEKCPVCGWWHCICPPPKPGSVPQPPPVPPTPADQQLASLWGTHPAPNGGKHTCATLPAPPSHPPA